MVRILILSLLLAGCYTTNKAKKQVVKAHALKPNVTAELCNSFYPTKDSISYKFEFIQGKKDTLTYIDTIKDTKDSIIYINSISYITTTDTVREEKNSSKESTSKTTHLNNQINELNELKAVNKQTISNLKESRNKWRLWLFIAIGLYLGKVFLTKKL